MVPHVKLQFDSEAAGSQPFRLPTTQSIQVHIPLMSTYFASKSD